MTGQLNPFFRRAGADRPFPFFFPPIGVVFPPLRAAKEVFFLYCANPLTLSGCRLPGPSL